MSKRFSNLEIILSGPEFIGSVQYVQRRHAEINPTLPALTDAHAITLILRQYATIINTVRS